MTDERQICMACNQPSTLGERYCFHCGHDMATPVTDLGADSVAVDAAGSRMLAGKYRLIEPVGEGRLGVEWRAEDVAGGRPVLVRLLAAALSAEDRVRKGLRALAGLTHPNLTTTLDVGVTAGGECFWAIDPPPGVSLRTLLTPPAPMAIRTAAAIAVGILRGAEAAHGRGHLHLDLTPDKVFVEGPASPTAPVRVLDFGAAPLLGAPWRNSGATMPVPALVYQSLEAITHSPVDARADLYAIGAILFEMVAGRPAGVAVNPMAMMAQRMAGEVPSLRAVRRDVPAALDELVGAALARDAGRRPASAAVMRARLDAAVEKS